MNAILNLSRNQKQLLFVVGLAFLGVLIYPPWHTPEMVHNQAGNQIPNGIWRKAGYDWLFDPPSAYAQIDYVRFGIGFVIWAVVSFLVVLSVWRLKSE